MILPYIDGMSTMIPSFLEIFRKYQKLGGITTIFACSRPVAEACLRNTPAPRVPGHAPLPEIHPGPTHGACCGPSVHRPSSRSSGALAAALWPARQTRQASSSVRAACKRCLWRSRAQRMTHVSTLTPPLSAQSSCVTCQIWLSPTPLSWPNQPCHAVATRQQLPHIESATWTKSNL